MKKLLLVSAIFFILMSACKDVTVSNTPLPVTIMNPGNSTDSGVRYFHKLVDSSKNLDADGELLITSLLCDESIITATISIDKKTGVPFKLNFSNGTSAGTEPYKSGYINVNIALHKGDAINFGKSKVFVSGIYGN